MKNSEIHVRKNKPLGLRRAMIIRCTAGTVWITSPGESQDIFLSTGQSHHCQGNGLMLIEGVSEGWIRLEKCEQPALWQRTRTAAGRLWRKMLSRTDRAASVPG